MNASIGQYQQIRQVTRAIPEQIVSGELLQLSRMELEQRIQAELERNPALTVEETALCPVCSQPAKGLPCQACGFAAVSRERDVTLLSDYRLHRDENGSEPERRELLGGVCNPRSLKEELAAQWRMKVKSEGAVLTIGLYLIESLDEEGFLKEPIFEIAERFRLSVPQIEKVLRAIQSLDLPGVGARDLQECLWIQAVRWETPCKESRIAAAILKRCWNELSEGDTKKIASALELHADDVVEGVAWLRENLTPYPARAYRDEWAEMAPRTEPEIVPDILIRATKDGLVVEALNSLERTFSMDPVYAMVHKSLSRDKSNPEGEVIRHSVVTAQTFIHAISQRNGTLELVMRTVAEAQIEFLSGASTHLKPLLQKTIAAELGIHESTICRALANKFVQLPTGETVPASFFFDTAAPVKDALQELVGRENPAKPLSDSRIAQLLNEMGYEIARRTVAKYRDVLNIPSVDQRKSVNPAVALKASRAGRNAAAPAYL